MSYAKTRYNAENDRKVFLDETGNIWLQYNGFSRIQITENENPTTTCKDKQLPLYSNPVASQGMDYILFTATCKNEQPEIFLTRFIDLKTKKIGKGEQGNFKDKDGRTITIDNTQELESPFFTSVEPIVRYWFNIGGIAIRGNQLGAEVYGFFFLPQEEEQKIITEGNKKESEGFYLADAYGSSITFSPSELLSGDIRPYTLELDNPRKKLLLSLQPAFYDKELPLKQSLTRKTFNIGDRKIFTEELSGGPLKCGYFTERINENYIVFYSGCRPKAEFDNNIKTLLTKETLEKDLSKLETNRLKKLKEKTKNKTRYYTFQNSIRSYNPTKNEESILKILENSFFSAKELRCKQQKNYPILRCTWSGYENYGETYRIFFINTNKYEELENCKTDKYNNIKTTEDKVTVICDQNPAEKTTEQETYDFNGNLIN